MKPSDIPADDTRCAIDPVVDTYSKLADVYDDDSNIGSCWGRVTRHALGLVRLRDTHKTVVDVGCGTGRELSQLASDHPRHVRFIGVEPAANMRRIAAARTARCPTASWPSIGPPTCANQFRSWHASSARPGRWT